MNDVQAARTNGGRRRRRRSAVALIIDGAGPTEVATGIPFFDHMLEQLGKHAGFDLTIDAKGDLDVDLHHTVEDVGIVLGNTLREALGDKRGVRRFANVLVPLDEALVQVALDLSGRPFLVYDVDPISEWIGTFDPQLAEEFWKGFVDGARRHAARAQRLRQERPPRDRGVVQGRRARVARRGEGRRRRRAVDQGHVCERRDARSPWSTTGSATCVRRRRRCNTSAPTPGSPPTRRRSSAARGVVLPGVGAFGACMQALRSAGLEGVCKEAATDGRPFLGICIGMQMLFDGSDETPDVAGLGIVAGRVTRLPDDVRLPQMGWNTLDIAPGSTCSRAPARSRVAVLRALVRARARRRRGRRRVVRLRPPVRGRDRARAALGDAVPPGEVG